jgi:hypothetical protein
MLAYYDNTGNATVLDFLVRMFANYSASDSTSDRSLTQIEALLEGHACVIEHHPFLTCTLFITFVMISYLL